MRVEKMAAMIAQLEADVKRAEQAEQEASKMLTDAYFWGYHKRDEEVRKLRAELAKLQNLLTGDR